MHRLDVFVMVILVVFLINIVNGVYALSQSGEHVIATRAETFFVIMLRLILFAWGLMIFTKHFLV